MKKQWMCQLLIGIAILVGLSACSYVPKYMYSPAVNNLTSQQQELLKNLEDSDIQVIKQGMVFTFVIPTDCFFNRDTRALKSHRGWLLGQLAQFVVSYTEYFVRPHVTVVGYTDKVWRYSESKVLSLHYAESIADYLREAGLDERALRVKAGSFKHPVASNGYPMATQFNRRVVIRVQ